LTYTANITVCSEICTKHSTQNEQHIEFLNVSPVVRKETAKL